MREGTGIQSSLANSYLKFKFADLIIPFFASVGFRQLPWASVEYQLPIYRWNADNNVRGRGAWIPSSGPNIYLALKFPALSIPILASVSFRGIPWTIEYHFLINRWGEDNNVCGRGLEAKAPDPIFT